jgi:hypothetical protein
LTPSEEGVILLKLKQTTEDIMHITYQELKDFLETLTPQQLAMPAMVYAGDVDDAMVVFATCFNSEEEMGESMEDIDVNQPFMQI